MPTELLASKLFIPPLRSSLVQRPRLIRLLNEGLYAKHRLTLISAPAGFGKTTLVVDWLKQIGCPVAWLSLDEGDNDLSCFLCYLVGAFQQVDEQIGMSLPGALQSPQPPELGQVLAGVLNDIAMRNDSIILVLDDVHLLGDQEISQVLGFIIDHQPPQLHVVLTTREDPDLPLARLRARDQLTEVRARDLRFTQDEATAFLRDVMGLALSAQHVAALEDRTEGWAAGLQLAGLSMQKHSDLSSFIAEFSGSHRHILDYLTGEVLQQQPENTRTFLLQTSILDRLNGSLCDAVTGRTDSHSILAHLEAANLFLIPLDDERRWYRYHHLFGDLLRNQLLRSQAEMIPELHGRASRWYEDNGDMENAVEHALQNTDLTQATRLIDRNAIFRLYAGDVSLVLSWFDRLPERMLESAPMMWITKAWALALMQRSPRQPEVPRLVEAANQALDRINADEELRRLIAGHIASIQAFALQTPVLMGEKPEKLIQYSQRAMQLLPESEKGIRSVNGLNIGFGYMSLVDLDAARLAFMGTLEDGLAGGNFYAAIYGPLNLVLIETMVGRLTKALQVCDTNIQRFNQILAGQNFSPLGALYIMRGKLLWEFDRPAEAERALNQGLDLIRWTGEYDAHRNGYSTLARLCAAQGDRSAMLEAVDTLERRWPAGALYAQACRHRLSTRHWPNDPDVQRDAQNWLHESGIDFDKLEAIHSLDPVREAYFESYLGAIHVLVRLANSRPDSYPLKSAQRYLEQQMRYAETHKIIAWEVAIAIASALLYETMGMKEKAVQTLQEAIRIAAPTGLFRVFVDEGELIRPLLQELRPRLTDDVLIAYLNRILQRLSGGVAKPERESRRDVLLSERELEVLRSLGHGLTYEEIGQQLFLSLNTVQFHVKSIYRKLLVNKRIQAIEKARELHLI